MLAETLARSEDRQTGMQSPPRARSSREARAKAERSNSASAEKLPATAPAVANITTIEQTRPKGTTPRIPDRSFVKKRCQRASRVTFWWLDSIHGSIVWKRSTSERGKIGSRSTPATRDARHWRPWRRWSRCTGCSRSPAACWHTGTRGPFGRRSSGRTGWITRSVRQSKA